MVNQGMSKFSDTVISGNCQLNANQSNPIARLIDKTMRNRWVRSGWQFIMIRCDILLPMHPEDEVLPDKHER